jgi:hypothetical protein
VPLQVHNLRHYIAGSVTASATQAIIATCNDAAAANLVGKLYKVSNYPVLRTK